MTTFKPDGWPSVIARIFTDDVDSAVGFIKSVFDGTGTIRPGIPAEIWIGDSLIMVSDGGGVREARSAFLYVYVENADEAYRRALEAGAVTIEPPGNMPYGDRRATVQDPWDNIWQIATRLPPQTPRSDASAEDGSGSS